MRSLLIGLVLTPLAACSGGGNKQEQVDASPSGADAPTAAAGRLAQIDEFDNESTVENFTTKLSVSGLGATYVEFQWQLLTLEWYDSQSLPGQKSTIDCSQLSYTINWGAGPQTSTQCTGTVETELVDNGEFSMELEASDLRIHFVPDAYTPKTVILDGSFSITD